jgi:ABC-type multidrug transport system fused ATPase/permease subunit
MELFRFLGRESKAFDRRIFFLGGLAGILNLAIVFGLTDAASQAAQLQSYCWALTQVALAMTAFWFSQTFLLRRTKLIVETIMENVRLRVARKIRDADLASIELVGKAPLYNAVSTHASNIAKAANGIFNSLASLVLLCGASLIILNISPKASPDPDRLTCADFDPDPAQLAKNRCPASHRDQPRQQIRSWFQRADQRLQRIEAELRKSGRIYRWLFKILDRHVSKLSNQSRLADQPQSLDLYLFGLHDPRRAGVCSSGAFLGGSTELAQAHDFRGIYSRSFESSNWIIPPVKRGWGID